MYSSLPPVNTKAEVRFHVDSADWLPQRVKDRLHRMVGQDRLHTVVGQDRLGQDRLHTVVGQDRLGQDRLHANCVWYGGYLSHACCSELSSLHVFCSSSLELRKKES